MQYSAINSKGSGAVASALATANSNKNYSPYTAPKPQIQMSPYTAPKTAVKSQTITDATGNTHTTEYHKPESEVKGSSSTVPVTPGVISSNNTPATPVPVPSAFQQSTSGLLNTGQGNNNNPTVNQANQGLIKFGQGQNSETVNKTLQNLKNLQDSQARAEAGIESTPEPIEQMQGQKGVQQRLYAGLLSNAQNAYGNALTAQGQQIGALNSAGGLGTSQQGQNIGALGSAAGYSAPQQYGLTSQPYNPVENTYGGGGANGALQRAAQAGNIQAIQGLAQSYQEGQAKLRAANNLEPQIVQTLQSNPALNQTQISAITNLNQWLSGQTSDPAQQQLASQVASYIQALGLSPDQAAAIAVQKGGTIGTLLKTLKDNFVAQNEANNPANVTSGGSSGLTTSSQSVLDKYGIK